MQGLWMDFLAGVRQFRKHPGTGLLAALTLSLAIGITAAAFGVIETELLRPLPFDQPERILLLRGANANGQPTPESLPHFLDLQRDSRAFDALGGYTTGRGTLRALGEPEVLQTVGVVGKFFDVFAVNPVMGRLFDPSSNADNAEGETAAVITYNLWRRHFGGTPSVIGKRFFLDGKIYLLAGVMPPDFRFPMTAPDSVLIPSPAARTRQSRGSHWLKTVARLKTGVTVDQAQTDLDRLCKAIGEANPADRNYQLRAHVLGKWIVQEIEGPLRAIWWAACGVLLMGCVNVGALLTSRAIARQAEVAVRIALGASRAAILRLVLLESFFLSTIGTAGGLGVAYALAALFRTFPATSLRGGSSTITPASLAMALLAMLVTSLLAGVMPMIRLARIPTSAALQDLRNSGRGRSQNDARGVLIVAQTATACLLLVVAGLLVETVMRWRATDLGFDPIRLISTELILGTRQYPGKDLYADVYAPLLDRIKAIPGVQSAGLVQVLPIQDWGWTSGIHIAGRPHDPPGQMISAEDRYVSPDYHRTFGVKLLKGRFFDPAIDTRNSPPVCLINKAFAQHIFGAADPLGQKIDEGAGPQCAIVGVVSSLRQQLFEKPAPEELWSLTQLPLEQVNRITTLNLVVHVDREARRVIPLIRAAIRQSNPGMPLQPVETMDEIVGEAISLQRLQAWVFGVFAALAICLAGAGLVGVISYEVETAQRDIGIRLALGATREMIAGSVLGRVATLLLIGIGLAVLGILAARPILASALTIRPTQELLPVAGLLASLFGLGLLASLVPALKAGSVDPVKTIRK